MNKRITAIMGAVAFTLAGTASAAGMFGSTDDVAYADKLWSAMQESGLVGEGSLMSTPYTGVHPHGAILDTIEAPLSVAGDTNTVIIKRNYGGEGVSKQMVANDPGKWLKAVTVMYKRAGLDAETKDWFWVKYSPDGKVLKNPKGASLAGLVGKDGTAGCIACHKAAPGGDLVFNHDRYK
ncbi:MAG: cytochrome P460 family protein [Sedimenticola sp.]